VLVDSIALHFVLRRRCRSVDWFATIPLRLPPRYAITPQHRLHWMNSKDWMNCFEPPSQKHPALFFGHLAHHGVPQVCVPNPELANSLLLIVLGDLLGDQSAVHGVNVVGVGVELVAQTIAHTGDLSGGDATRVPRASILTHTEHAGQPVGEQRVTPGRHGHCGCVSAARVDAAPSHVCPLYIGLDNSPVAPTRPGVSHLHLGFENPEHVSDGISRFLGMQFSGVGSRARACRSRHARVWGVGG